MKRLVRHQLEDVEMWLCSEHHGQKKTFFKITQFTKAAYNFYLSRPPHIFPLVTIKTAIKGQSIDVIVLRISPHVHNLPTDLHRSWHELRSSHNDPQRGKCICEVAARIRCHHLKYVATKIFMWFEKGSNHPKLKHVFSNKQ